MQELSQILTPPRRIDIAGAPPGYDALILARLAAAGAAPVVFIARDDVRLAATAEGVAFFAPDLNVVAFPAWDCLPYDRISPNPEIVSRRIAALTRVAVVSPGERPRIILTTVSAVLQRIVPADVLAGASRALNVGDRIERDELIGFLGRGGYGRVETVTEPGDFAVRGGIIDIFPSGAAHPVRLDLFGDEVETIRVFDTDNQRTIGTIEQCALAPISEVILDPASIARFRSAYRQAFGAESAVDPLYEAISAGRRAPGCEHWLSLFYPALTTLLDYVPDARVVVDHGAEAVRDERLDMIADYFAARMAPRRGGAFTADAPPYRPVPPASLFLDAAEWDARFAALAVARLSPFPAAGDSADIFDAGGRLGVDLAAARAKPDLNVFDELRLRIAEHQAAGRRVVIAAVSRGSRERLASVAREHGLTATAPADTWADLLGVAARIAALIVLPLERGFVTPDLAVIAEQDILGERLVTRRPRRGRAETFLTEARSLETGDLVVHIEHGIGRYEGLETIAVDGAPHDCLRIVYAGDDKLYLPVENIEMVSRFGSETQGVVLDKLGGAAWQGRKARMKQRIREMAGELIAVAAGRALRNAAVIEPPHGLFDEFCARFPYTETEDQAKAIGDVLADLASGRPTDRLICGDVGFGKTEVALRATFAAVLDGRQAAIVVPTTLLCRQHFRTFSQRFGGLPVRLGELSRMVTAKDAKAVKAGLRDGTIDIVVGTHALLAADLAFRDLGLLVIDEEQHFGVAHKERLKKLKSDVHVLTLSATPIPRTLQLSLAGVRELSLITTPPVDRLAVRTYVLEFDGVVIREALLRERHRGGQSFYVCPRIDDLDEVGRELAALVPELKVVVAHGRLPVRDLEAAVGAFYEGRYDVLLSTNIIESGLDLPTVNTIVVHRADMFGLSQLYQLRGRVGRSKLRAYAYLTLPPRKTVTPAAQKRLSVMQALDALGAGFTLASHDLDIRGAGNLLGEEQSGHIREVGIELYQQMLEDAIAELRVSSGEGTASAMGAGGDEWTPQLSIGISVLIPEAYVPDLGVRLGLYRRLGDLKEDVDIEAFAAELIDRFGPLPDEVENLLQVMAVKQLCRRAGIEKVDAGPKGAVLSFRNNTFADPAGLVQLINRRLEAFKLRPDHKLVYRCAWGSPPARLRGLRNLIGELARLAERTGRRSPMVPAGGGRA
ncbi:MAG: transcription-repair coupling factor [Rhodospirillales bacterium]|nr:transcription-repair coupling factor [Rhodospirillales bacterium]